jgi:hypothetical protein
LSFRLEIDDLEGGRFNEVTGLSADVVELMEIVHEGLRLEG